MEVWFNRKKKIIQEIIKNIIKGRRRIRKKKTLLTLRIKICVTKTCLGN